MDLIPHALRHGQKKTEKETDTDTYFLIISPNAGDKGFQVMLVVKDLSAYSGDAGSIPGSGISSGVGNGNSL